MCVFVRQVHTRGTSLFGAMQTTHFRMHSKELILSNKIIFVISCGCFTYECAAESPKIYKFYLGSLLHAYKHTESGNQK